MAAIGIPFTEEGPNQQSAARGFESEDRMDQTAANRSAMLPYSGQRAYPSPRTLNMQPPAPATPAPFGGQFPNAPYASDVRSNLAKPYIANEQAYKQSLYSKWMRDQQDSLNPTPAPPPPAPAGYGTPGTPNTSNTGLPAPATTTPTPQATPQGPPPPTPAFDRNGTTDAGLDALGKKYGIERGTSSGLGQPTTVLPNAIYAQKIRQQELNDPNSDFNKNYLPANKGYQKIHGDTVTAQEGLAHNQLPGDAIKDRDQAAADAKDPEAAAERKFQSSLAGMSPKDAAAAQVAHDRQKSEAANETGKLNETKRNNIAMNDTKSRQQTYNALSAFGKGVAGLFEKGITASAKATAKTTDPDKARNEVENQWAKVENDIRDHRQSNAPSNVKDGSDANRKKYEGETESAIEAARTQWERRHPSVYQRTAQLPSPNDQAGPAAPPGVHGNPNPPKPPLDPHSLVVGPTAPPGYQPPPASPNAAPSAPQQNPDGTWNHPKFPGKWKPVPGGMEKVG